MFGMMVMPMIVFGKDTYFGYLSFLKYIYPYFDLTVKVVIKNGQTEQLAQLVNIDIPDENTLYYSIAFYMLLLICL